jgi:hypothetical protein
VCDIGARLPTTDATLCRELAAVHRSDLALVVSPYEQHLLSAHLGVPAHKVALAPFLFDDAALARCAHSQFDGAARPRSERRHFFSIGNFQHAPNADAVHYMAARVWPRVRRLLVERATDAASAADLGGTEMHVYGAYPRALDMALDSPATGFRVRGPLPATANLARKFAAYRVQAAPLRFGAGVMGKFCDSWMSGVPVVTTRVGAEGMYLAAGGGAVAGFACSACAEARRAGVDAELEFGGLVVSLDHGGGDEAFAHAMVRLYTDADVWSARQAIGTRTLAAVRCEGRLSARVGNSFVPRDFQFKSVVSSTPMQHFSRAAVAPPLLAALEAALARKHGDGSNARSSSDLLQAAFWTPSAASSEAMSVYVEAKVARERAAHVKR